MAIGTSDGQVYEDELSYHMKIPMESDYDMEGFKNSGQTQADNGHYPDTYKLPNHITFSDQSMHHGVDGNEGGKWAQLNDGRWSFTPGATNFKHHSLQDMIDYFKKYEPGNVLNAQASDQAVLSGANSFYDDGPSIKQQQADDANLEKPTVTKLKELEKDMEGQQIINDTMRTEDLGYGTWDEKIANDLKVPEQETGTDWHTLYGPEVYKDPSLLKKIPDTDELFYDRKRDWYWQRKIPEKKPEDLIS